MTRGLLIAVAPAVLACLTTSAPAAAQATPARPTHLRRLDDPALAAARGGFVWAGMSISFGADLQTFLNGQLALRTLVNWSDTGASTSVMVGSSLTPANLALSGVRAASAIDVPAALAGKQVYVGNAGQTALAQGAADGLQNILLNSANNLKANQTIDATLTIGNYASYATALRASVLSNVMRSQAAALGR